MYPSLRRLGYTNAIAYSPSSQLGGSSNVVRIQSALTWGDEWFNLARQCQYAVQEGKLNIKAFGNLGGKTA